MNTFPRFLLSIVISSIIYPVTMVYAGKSLPEIQRRRYQKAYGFQKMPRQTKAQRIAERKYETKENRTRLKAQYNSSLKQAIENEKTKSNAAPLKINEIILADGRKFKFFMSNQPQNNNFIDLTK